MTKSNMTTALFLCVAFVTFFELFIYDRYCDDVSEATEAIIRFVSKQTVTYQQIVSITVSHASLFLQLETAEYTGIVTGEADLANERFWILKDVETKAIMELSGRVAASAELVDVIIRNSAQEGIVVHVYLEEPKPRAIYTHYMHNFDYPGSNWQTHGERVLATGHAYILCLQSCYEKLREEAISSGLLERAKANAEEFFKELEEIQYMGRNITVCIHWGEEVPPREVSPALN